jgi:transposase-like protein
LTTVESAPAIFYASQKTSDGASFERTSIEAPARLHRHAGQGIDFLLADKRDMAAAKRFFYNTMGANSDPNKVAMDKSGDNDAAMDTVNAGRDVPILVMQVEFLKNIVEQDHRAIKLVTKSMLNFNCAGPLEPHLPALSRCT